MHPEIVRIGNFPIRSYGVMLAVAVFIALILARKRAARHGINPDKLWDAVIWVVIPGILGARGVYIALNWHDYAGNIGEIFNLQMNGLTSFGGLVFGAFGLIGWAKFSKISIISALDTVGLPFVWAQAIGRMGCLLNGCCYGFPYSGPLAVVTPDKPGLYFPSQILDAAMLVVGSIIILLMERRKLKSGQFLSLAMIVWGISRFLDEFTRAGGSSELLRSMPVTKAQVASLILTVGAIVGFFIAGKYGKQLPVEEKVEK